MTPWFSSSVMILSKLASVSCLATPFKKSAPPACKNTFDPRSNDPPASRKSLSCFSVSALVVAPIAVLVVGKPLSFVSSAPSVGLILCQLAPANMLPPNTFDGSPPPAMRTTPPLALRNSAWRISCWLGFTLPPLAYVSRSPYVGLCASTNGPICTTCLACVTGFIVLRS